MSVIENSRPASEKGPARVLDLHPARRAAILKSHPELKVLAGRCPRSALIAILLVVSQVATAVSLADRQWYWAIAVAVFLGAFIAHALNCLIHEATHNLIFRRKSWNKAVGIFANLPGVAPTAIIFRHYHLLHHRFLGEPGSDPDLPLEFETRMVGSSAWRKLAWLALLPAAYGGLHLLPVRRRVPLDGWLLANIVVVSGFIALVALLLGWNSLLYLTTSAYLAVGLHPTGAHILQEHIIFDGRYETASYYGWINLVSGNHGCHVEHHDFPDIPGPRLPKIRRLAPEFYDDRYRHRSRLAVLWKFVLDRNVRLDARMIGPISETHMR